MAQLLNNTVFDSQGFLSLPRGTTAQRPATPLAGMMRVNTDVNRVEVYDGIKWGSAVKNVITFKNVGVTFWQVPAGVTSVEVLVVGGGGGGGQDNGGGGGGGGVISNTNYSVTPGAQLKVVVGYGGQEATGSNQDNQKNGGD